MRRVAVALVTVVALAGCGNSTTHLRDADVGVRGRPMMGPYLFDIPGAIKSLKAHGITARRTVGPGLLREVVLRRGVVDALEGLLYFGHLESHGATRTLGERPRIAFPGAHCPRVPRLASPGV